MVELVDRASPVPKDDPQKGQERRHRCNYPRTESKLHERGDTPLTVPWRCANTPDQIRLRVDDQQVFVVSLSRHQNLSEFVDLTRGNYLISLHVVYGHIFASIEQPLQLGWDA